MGQHWLKDDATLEAICEAANLSHDDTVLEIGPGLGDLTRRLIRRANSVVAVEMDAELAANLATGIAADNLVIVRGNILEFDLSELPVAYKVVANIPYYLTSNLLRTLSESSNPPLEMTLLVQKEVAERICAKPGQMSLLAVSVQLYYQPKLGPAVAAELFTPPPKVDSQVVIMQKRPKPLFKDLDSGMYFRIVKAGFAGRRKKLRGSLSAGLNISKEQADQLLKTSGVDGGRRAQELSLREWHTLYKNYKSNII